MKIQKGFTLIELMIVVAIIAILAAIALPAYQNYVARAQATAGLADIRGGVTAFEEIINRGQLPGGAVAGVPTAGQIGLLTATARCTTVTIGTTGIEAASGQSIACTDLIGNPSVRNDDITLTRTATGWTCTTNLEENFRPTGCAATPPPAS